MLRCCYAFGKVCWVVVDMLPCGWSGGCKDAAMWLLGCSGRLSWCCYVVDRVFWEVAMMLLCGWCCVLGFCYDVGIWLLRCIGRLLGYVVVRVFWEVLGCCYVVDRVFCVVANWPKLLQVFWIFLPVYHKNTVSPLT